MKFHRKTFFESIYQSCFSVKIAPNSESLLLNYLKKENFGFFISIFKEICRISFFSSFSYFFPFFYQNIYFHFSVLNIAFIKFK